MAIINASAASLGVDFSMGAQFTFLTEDATGTNSGTAYSWITSAGSDVQATGSGITFAGGAPTSGTVTRLDVDLGDDASEDVTITGLNDALTLVAGSYTDFFEAVFSGDDRITGSAFGDILLGGDGDDRFVGGGGGDSFDGGDGIDAVDYGALDERVKVDLLFSQFSDFGATGDSYSSIENVFGTELRDELRGDNSDNRLFGGEGNDYLAGRAGDDELYGGNGNDALLGGAGADFLIGGAGTDRAQYTDATEGVIVTIGGGTAGGAAGDILFSIENLRGSNFADELTGDDDDNELEGLAGNDFLDGKGGDDILRGGTGDDNIRGGAGNDIILAGSGDDDLRGDGGTDLIRAGAGNDIIRNGDFIFAGTGNDTIIYNLDPNVKAFGQAGDDIFMTIGFSTVFVNSAELDGGTGFDSVFFSPVPFQFQNLLDLRDQANNAGSAKDDTFTNIEAFHGADSTFDVFYGDNRDNHFFGLGATDRLTGLGGDDLLDGGEGDDILNGGARNDLLIGGVGNDRLFGGGQDDAFRFNAPDEGVDAIEDFEQRGDDDTIELSATGFTSLNTGALASTSFVAGSAALDADDYVIYDNGDLYYDADGSGAEAQVLIAQFTGAPSVDADDFLVIA